MFFWPSKPRQVSNPNTVLETLKRIGKIQNYRCQIKKHGCRAIIWLDESGTVKIFDRRNTLLTMAMEFDWSPLKKIFPANTMLDGELIGRKQGEISNRLYLWDMPMIDSTDLTAQSYDERHQELTHSFQKSEGLFSEGPEWIYREIGDVTIGVARSFPAETWEELFSSVDYNGSHGENEGIVFKDITHPLGWSRSRTTEIPQQLKYLHKYANSI